MSSNLNVDHEKLQQLFCEASEKLQQAFQQMTQAWINFIDSLPEDVKKELFKDADQT